MVVSTYWDMVAVLENIEVQKSSVELSQQLLKDNKARLQVGLDVPTVAVEGYHAAKEIVRYLLGLGHTRLGHISGPADRTSSASDRLQRFHDILEESNLKPSWTFSTEYNMESCALVAREWITLPERPTAVFCSCDEVAFGFNSALYRNGFRVPRDVSVVGFDDVPLAEFSIPSLTTIRQPHLEIGIQAVRLILKLIQTPTKLQKACI